MKTFKFSAIIVAIAFVFGGATADAQMFSKDATRTFKPSKEAKKEAKNLGVLELADKQAKSLIKGILKDVSNGYTIKFK